MDNASKLLDLAKENFGTPTEAEEKLFKAVVNGEVADYSAEAEEDNDPARANEWGPERVLKADRIAWLCTDKPASELVTHRGIWVKGARIEGELDLEEAQISFRLAFEKSVLQDGINLRHGKLRALYLLETYTGSIRADGLKLEGDVFLRNGFRAEGEVRLLGATIGGNLNCRGGEFVNADGYALNADRLKVEGNVFLRNGFKAEGEVRLLGAGIGGNLECDKGRFINADGYALSAAGLKVEGYVFLRNGFKAEGEVCLLGASIGGNLECGNSQFVNADGYALNANGLSVKGSVFLRDGFEAEGEVRLLGASIGRNLDCRKGQFVNADGKALNADGLKVEGDVFLRDGFKAEGDVILVGASMDNYFVWTGVDSPEKSTLDLRSAEIDTLWDEEKSWPNSGKLSLHGLVYHEIDDDAPRDAETRIAWLRRQYDDKAEQDKKQFRPQPYEQLAAVLRKSGDDAAAKKILIAKNKDKARLTKVTRSGWLWYRLFGPIIAYGYRPWRALWIGLLLVSLGWLFFWAGYRAQVMSPAKDNAQTSAKFCAFVYSLDVFVPLVDLHQASYWLPNANLKGDLAISEGFTLPVSGRILRYYLWFEIVAGWVLTTLLVVGVTGLVRT